MTFLLLRSVGSVARVHQIVTSGGVDGLSDDPAAGVGGKEGDDVGDVGRFAEAAERVRALASTFST